MNLSPDPAHDHLLKGQSKLLGNATHDYSLFLDSNSGNAKLAITKYDFQSNKVGKEKSR